MKLPDRKLHIGGEIASHGWELLNIRPLEGVDHVCDALDLSRFADNTFSAVYAAYVLQLFCYGEPLGIALREWHRVLLPGGRIYISVPNMAVVARIYQQRDRLSFDEVHELTSLIYGEQKHAHDYHKCGLTAEFLPIYFSGAGFVDVKKVKSFDIFDDSSVRNFRDMPISLNMTAVKAHCQPLE